MNFRSIVFAISLTLSAHLLLAQNILTLTNGEQVHFKKLKRDTEMLQLETDDEREFRIPSDSAVSYLDTKQQITFYKVPNLDVREGYTFGKKIDYDFLKRELDGEIKIYSKNVTTTGNSRFGPDSRSYKYVFLQKDDKYEHVMIVNSRSVSKKKMNRIIRSFIEDDELTVERFDRGFKFTYDELVSLITFYNDRVKTN